MLFSLACELSATSRKKGSGGRVALSVRHLYYGWERVARRLVDGVRDLDAEALALGQTDWPIWAIAAHVAAGRVEWLCGVAGEPGRETTPFIDADDHWEFHLDHPRSAREVVEALESTWRIVAAALDNWTEPMLIEKVELRESDVIYHQSRASILVRLLTHDTFHTGEVSAVLGSHGLTAVDPWDRPSPEPDPLA